METVRRLIHSYSDSNLETNSRFDKVLFLRRSKLKLLYLLKYRGVFPSADEITTC
jgi:hypothetical protein